MPKDISGKKDSDTILIVDDDPMVASSLAAFLEKEGYPVLKAMGAEEALSKIRSHHVAVAIVDQIMPGMSGIDLLKIFKDEYPEIIRILISGYADLRMAQEAIVSGEVFRFLTKPWKLEDLRLHVRQALEYHALRQENLRLLEELQNWNKRLQREVEKKTRLLKESEEKYRHLFEKAPAGIVLVDPEEGGRILDCNMTFQKMTGYGRHELRKMTLWEIQDPALWKGDRSAFLRVLNEGKSPFLKLPFIRKDGTKLYVDFYFSWGRFRNRRFIQGSCIDVTERIELDRSLTRANKLARQRSEELEEFVNITTHEIRSHLVPTIGYAKMLSEDYRNVLDEKALKWLDEMKKSGQSVKELIAAIMNVSKLKTQVDDFHMVDTKRVLRDVTELMSHRLNQRGIKLTVADDMPPIFGDQLKIKILFQNLIENAIKYIDDKEPKPAIEIGFTEGDGFYEFFIKDTGVGIPEEHCREVFKPLWAGSRKKGESTGMGLYYVKKIMELHGGDIRVEPRQDRKGSVFYFHFPKVMM